MDLDIAIDTLSALAHNTRLETFRLLVQTGSHGLPAGDISHQLNVRQNTLSTHLGLLQRAGLITSSREGRSIRYRANYSAMNELINYLLEDCCRGDVGASSEQCN